MPVLARDLTKPVRASGAPPASARRPLPPRSRRHGSGHAMCAPFATTQSPSAGSGTGSRSCAGTGRRSPSPAAPPLRYRIPKTTGGSSPTPRSSGHWGSADRHPSIFHAVRPSTSACPPISTNRRTGKSLKQALRNGRCPGRGRFTLRTSLDVEKLKWCSAQLTDGQLEEAGILWHSPLYNGY